MIDMIVIIQETIAGIEIVILDMTVILDLTVILDMIVQIGVILA